MMLDAITFDLGGGASTRFVLPDVSNIVPLSLPDGLLQGQNHQHAQPSEEAVRRFDVAMSVESPTAMLRAASALRVAIERPVIPAERGSQAVIAEGSDKPVASESVAKPAIADGLVKPVVERGFAKPVVVKNTATPAVVENLLRTVVVDDSVKQAVVESAAKPVVVEGPARQVVAENHVNLENPVKEESRHVTVSVPAPAAGEKAFDEKVVVVEKPAVAAAVDSRGEIETRSVVVGAEAKPETRVVVETGARHETRDVAVEEKVFAKPVIAEVSVKPVVDDSVKHVVESAAKPVVVDGSVRQVVSENHVNLENPVKEESRPATVEPQKAEGSKYKVESADKTEEKAVAASAHVTVAPAAVEAPVPQTVQVPSEAAAVSAASARTEAVVETVNQVVEAVAGQLLVTPGIAYGEGEVKIMLKPTVLDGSEITMSSKDGTLTVYITPATQGAMAAAEAALPRLETALAEHAPAFHHVSVALASKKGSRNETV